jgi:hypothetical protein
MLGRGGRLSAFSATYSRVSPDVRRTFTGCTSQLFGTYIKEISDVRQRKAGRASPESMTYVPENFDVRPMKLRRTFLWNRIVNEGKKNKIFALLCWLCGLKGISVVVFRDASMHNSGYNPLILRLSVISSNIPFDVRKKITGNNSKIRDNILRDEK